MALMTSCLEVRMMSAAALLGYTWRQPQPTLFGKMGGGVPKGHEMPTKLRVNDASSICFKAS